jgi:REP element-mobilizing transposase RayT
MNPHSKFNPSRPPIAYLITFRTHGTWLHGDPRGSVDRFHNRYNSPYIPGNRCLQLYNERSMKLPPVKLTEERRAAVDKAIVETCSFRKWTLWTRNVRTNHVHAVVTAFCDPETVLAALKANATRVMRETNCWQSAHTPWVRKGSKRWLWTEKALTAAIAYVDYDQGESLP